MSIKSESTKVLERAHHHWHFAARLFTAGCVAFTITATASAIRAQEFPEVYNSERDNSETLVSASEAAAGVVLPPGFSTTVFASEPEIQNPIGAAWDSQGRLWVAENYTYSDRSERFDLNLRDRVVVLHDQDGDGVSDRRTVFTDQVQMLTSIAVGRGGVWLLCPPQLLFIPDADQDGVADGPARVVLDGFEVAKENYHNFANGLKWGPDGWLYGRCGGSCPGQLGLPGTPTEQRVVLEGGIWRFNPTTGSCEVLCHGTTNPWGHDWNRDYEMFFINTVNGHLWHMIPGAHFTRPFTLDPNPYTYKLIDFHADHWHFDTGKSWTDSRDGAADSYGGGHAHSGVTIYQGNAWPEEYDGRLFTVNLHGKRLNQELLERHGSGYVAKHAPDFFKSKDPFFRAVELLTGPQGQMWVMDWSDTGECHEHTGVHRQSGRIYRISYNDGQTRQGFPQTAVIGSLDLNQMSDLELVKLQSNPNEWWVRQAREVLATRTQTKKLDDAAEAQLKTWLHTAETDYQVRLRALLTASVTNCLSSDELTETLDDSNPHLRVWAIRLLTDDWRIDDCLGVTYQSPAEQARLREESTALLPKLVEMAEQEDSGLVLLTLASTLQRLPVEKRIELAAPLAANHKYDDDHNLPALVWYGMIPTFDEDPQHLVELAKRSAWSELTRWSTRRLMSELDSRTDRIDSVIEFAMTSADETKRIDILKGMSEGLKGWRQAPAPSQWASFSEWGMASTQAEVNRLTRELNVMFGDGLALDSVMKLVVDNQVAIDVRRSALQALVDRNPPGLKGVCLQLLNDARINLIAAKGLSQFDDPEVGRLLVQRYRRFRSPLRPQIISILVSRESYASSLLDAIETGKIDLSDVTAFDVRQLRSLNVADFNERISQIWGEVRQSPAETIKRIELLKSSLQGLEPTSKQLSSGRVLFQTQCAKCHKLYGEGSSIGPDLTGANRNNLDYLLENILDPSAVVSKDYRMSIVTLLDGRVVNGLITSRDDKTTTIQTQTELLTFANDEIDDSTLTTESPMPAGILNSMSETDVTDLLNYLRHPSQVPLPPSAQGEDSSEQ